MRILRPAGKGMVDVLFIDTVLSMSISRTMTITEHPVEDGSTISDHARAGPIEVSVTGIVSNTPIWRVGLGVIPGIAPNNRQTAYKALMELQSTKQAVQITTELDVYADMVLTDLNCPRNRTNFHGLEFTATFRQITKVGLKVVQLKDEEQTKALASPATNVGRQTADTAAPKADANASILYNAMMNGVMPW